MHNYASIWSQTAENISARVVLLQRNIHCGTSCNSLPSSPLQCLFSSPGTTALRQYKTEVRPGEAAGLVGNLVKSTQFRQRVLRLLKYVCFYFISTQTKKKIRS